MKHLKALRVEAGMTQAQLAKLINMPFSSYQRKEAGLSKFTVDEAYKISKVLGLTIEEIFFTNRVSIWGNTCFNCSTNDTKIL